MKAAHSRLESRFTIPRWLESVDGRAKIGAMTPKVEMARRTVKCMLSCEVKYEGETSSEENDAEYVTSYTIRRYAGAHVGPRPVPCATVIFLVHRPIAFHPRREDAESTGVDVG